MNKKISFYAFAVISSALMLSCSGNSNNNSQSDELKVPEGLVSDAPLKLSEEAMGSVVQNIASPVEMANLIKSSGVDFSQKILNSTDKADSYNTSFKRALNLGVYSADLGYINIFDKNTIVISYLMSIKNLSEGIKVGQFFDFNTLKSVATNSSNLDSLMQISMSSFNRMDAYLRSQNRSNVSALIVTGTWIEGLYITSNVIEQTAKKDAFINPINKGLVDRMGEQKDIVDILQIFLQNYQSDPNFAKLSEQIEGLRNAFKGVTITTEVGQATKVEKNGVLMIEQNEISHVNITPEQLKAIIEQVKIIRAIIVS